MPLSSRLDRGSRGREARSRSARACRVPQCSRPCRRGSGAIGGQSSRPRKIAGDAAASNEHGLLAIRMRGLGAGSNRTALGGIVQEFAVTRHSLGEACGDHHIRTDCVGGRRARRNCRRQRPRALLRPAVGFGRERRRSAMQAMIAADPRLPCELRQLAYPGPGHSSAVGSPPHLRSYIPHVLRRRLVPRRPPSGFCERAPSVRRYRARRTVAGGMAAIAMPSPGPPCRDELRGLRARRSRRATNRLMAFADIGACRA